MNKFATIALLFILAAFTAPAMFASERGCSDNANILIRPSFKGLKRQVIDSDVSSEGAKFEYYFYDRRLRYVVASMFGETGKSVLLAGFIKESRNSYSVIYSKYFYSAPIYDTTSKVIFVQTKKMIICSGKITLGVGGQPEVGKDVSSEVVRIMNSAFDELDKSNKGSKKGGVGEDN